MEVMKKKYPVMVLGPNWKEMMMKPPPPWIKQRPRGTWGGGGAGRGGEGWGGWRSQDGPGFAMQVCGGFEREGVKCYLDGPESSLEC